MSGLSPLALAGALIATGLVVAAPAGAAVRKVHYSDADLATAAGRAAIDHRLAAAAGSACAEENRDLTLVAACRRTSLVAARADLSRAIHADAVEMASR